MPIEYIYQKWKAAQEAKRIKYAPQSENTNEHLIPLEELCAKLKTDPERGLSKSNAEIFQALYGPNCLTPPILMPKWVRFLKNMFEGFALLLWAGAVLCFFAYSLSLNYDNLYLGVVLVLVVVLTGGFSYYQEATSAEIMESFQKMVPRTATVWRDGEPAEINSVELTKGDVIRVKAGDLISADIRIIKQQNCRVDNSSLTGESEPQSRSVKPTSKIALESKNMAFFGTNCVDGSAKGIVLAIGDGSAMGRIANLTANLERGQTPINKEIGKFIFLITIFAFVMGFLLFILTMSIGTSFVESIVFFISIIVANVPEGLLATVTVCLTLTAKRMARKNCLVKNLESVETLGSTSVICSDKTGTLTQNRMTVSHFWVGNQFYSTSKVKPDTIRVNLHELENTVEAMAGLLALGTNATFCDSKDVPIEQRKTIGDASESGILKFLERNLMPMNKVLDLRKEYPRAFEIPFNSSTKTHLVIHELKKNDSHYLLILKGAPERVIMYCSSVLTDRDVYPINDRFKSNFEKALEYFGGLGERVLGVAFYCLPIESFPKRFKFDNETKNFPTDNLTFAGLVSLIDPPKPGVKISINRCRHAGIKVAMVTGDHPLTARTIAESVDLITTRTYEKPEGMSFSELPYVEGLSEYKSFVMTGADLIESGTEGLLIVINLFEEMVFARTSPEQKLMIVDAFQKRGHIVAVTGDGVNDSPALKKADIGIAMGITGSDVSKQAADMILLDDDFTSIIFAIEEGRTIFENLKKSIAYTLTSNIPEMAPFVLHFITGVPLPLSTIAILCIDLGTDILPAISLAYEQPESDIMTRPPRGDNDRLVGHALIRMAYALVGCIQAACGFFVYFCIMAENGFFYSTLSNTRNTWLKKGVIIVDYYGQEWHYGARERLQYACQTAFFAAIVVTQWFDLLICKTRRNSLFKQKMHNQVLNFSILTEALIAFAFIYYPGTATYLHFYPVLLRWWLYAVPWGISIVMLDEYRRWYLRTFPGSFIQYATNY